jgi:hypothetical protein
MSYTDLGKYTFTTAADYTGFNPGNLTSVLDPAAIRIPNYELYRLLINTSAVPNPAALPSIVQVTPIVAGSSLTALDLTFPAAVTEGNLVVAGYGATAVTTDPHVSGIELGGSADHWGKITAHDQSGDLELWADPSAAEASDAIAIATTGGSGQVQTIGMAWEIDGALDTSTPADCVDAWYQAYSYSQSPSLATAGFATAAANDMMIGFGTGYAGDGYGGGGTFTIAQPQGFAATSYLQPALILGDSYGGGAGSYGLAGAKGSTVSYSMGAVSPGEALWNVIAAAFLPSASPPGPVALPFTVAVDGVTWDSEQTTAGVGYTYTIGQSPLYLKTGQTLQILWDLPAASYLPYAQAFNITGWFRYDPANQP